MCAVYTYWGNRDEKTNGTSAIELAAGVIPVGESGEFTDAEYQDAISIFDLRLGAVLWDRTDFPWPRSPGSPPMSSSGGSSGISQAAADGLYVHQDGTGLPSSVVSASLAYKAQGNLWTPGGCIAQTCSRQVCAGATATMVSGQPYFVGGAVLPAGSTANGIGMLAQAASVVPTHCVFGLALPDDDPALSMATILATSVDDVSGVAWAQNATKELSLKTSDGGSGAVSVNVDTPVYVFIWQAANTPAKTFGPVPSAQFGNVAENPKEFATAAGGLTDPTSIPGVVTLSGTAVAPYAYILGTYGSPNA